MRKLYSDFDTFNIVCKLMTVIILELNLYVHTGAEREVQCLIHILACKIKYVSNKDIQHYNLITECLVLFNYDSDFTIFIEGLNSLFIDQLNNGCIDLLILV